MRLHPADSETEPDSASLEALGREIEACHFCAYRGYVAISRPLDRGKGRRRILLVGQAPGFGEGANRIAFGGPAGRTLMRWFAQTGLSEA